jgi:hypothetical protein
MSVHMNNMYICTVPINAPSEVSHNLLKLIKIPFDETELLKSKAQHFCLA